MSVEQRCSFYRSLGTFSAGLGIGYCDLECDKTMCRGEIKLCEKADTLKTYLLKRKWMKGAIRREGIPGQKEF